MACFLAVSRISWHNSSLPSFQARIDLDVARWSHTFHATKMPPGRHAYAIVFLSSTLHFHTSSWICGVDYVRNPLSDFSDVGIYSWNAPVRWVALHTPGDYSRCRPLIRRVSDCTCKNTTAVALETETYSFTDDVHTVISTQHS